MILTDSGSWTCEAMGKYHFEGYLLSNTAIDVLTLYLNKRIRVCMLKT